MAISLKKRLSFDELVQENRKQIMEDKRLLDRIERTLAIKRHQTPKYTLQDRA